MDIPDNNHSLPDEEKVCETCGETGKDSLGKYPGLYQYNKVQHPVHIDWDDVRKYGR
jgi:hypothetical protein